MGSMGPVRAISYIGFVFHTVKKPTHQKAEFIKFKAYFIVKKLFRTSNSRKQRKAEETYQS